MNYSDSERIAGVLELANYEKTLQESDADLIVINMCSVRESAVSRISGNFHKYKKYKKINQNFKTVITGCVLESDKEKFGKLFDLVIDIKEIEKLPKRLKSISNNKILPEFKTPQPPLSGGTDSSSIQQKQKILNQVQNDKDKPQVNNTSDYFSINPQHESKTTAYVPIMTGCNNFCSYCVVPYTRGREYSRPAKEVLDEIKNLIDKGYKEIILLGQNVNSYESEIKDQESKFFTQNNPNYKSNQTKWIPASAEMTEKINFPKLLKLINDISGDFWIRFLTSHPKDISEELIKTVAQCEKCTECIHLALQSGDDDILEKMNRKYTAEHFLNLVAMIRKYIPNVAITTDIIVGFPSETKKQFQNTVKIMKKVKFDMAYINKYSPRTGTVSAKMTDSVSWDEKKERENILNTILEETALENNKKYIGKIVDVLIEKVDNDYIYGKMRSFKNVKATADSIVPIGAWNQCANAKKLHSPKGTMEPAIGEFVKIKITQVKPWNLEGMIYG